MAMAATDVAAGLIAGATDKPKASGAVRLAVAVVLFWLAGLLLFIAFGAGADFIPSTWGKGKGLSTFRHGVQKMLQKGATDTKGASPAS